MIPFMKIALRRWFANGLLPPLNLLLVLIAGLSAAYWTWSIWETFRATRTTSSNLVIESPKLPTAAIAVNAHLFGQPGQAAASVAALSSQRLKLVGTFSSVNEHSGYALIAIDGGHPSPFTKGAEVVNGIVIREVAPDHVMLSRAGAVERLELSSKPRSTSQVVSSRQAQPAATTPPAIPAKR